LDKENLRRLVFCLEQLYAERGAYRAISRLNPQWTKLFEQAMADPRYRSEVAQRFFEIGKRLEADQRFDDLLL
jgi:hypothetical protein